MCLLIESIKVLDGKLYNLKYHNQRMQKARELLFGIDTPIQLEEILQVPVAYRQGLVKCRVLYKEEIQQVTFAAYQKRNIQSLQLVFDDTINYTYKYADRTHLERLYTQKGSADDILIVRRGELTDTMYGNIGFFDGKKWYTPANPLLQGTQRQRLLDEQVIEPALITIEDLRAFEAIRVFNALNEFEEQPLISIDQIVV